MGVSPNIHLKHFQTNFEGRVSIICPGFLETFPGSKPTPPVGIPTCHCGNKETAGTTRYSLRTLTQSTISSVDVTCLLFLTPRSVGFRISCQQPQNPRITLVHLVLLTLKIISVLAKHLVTGDKEGIFKGPNQ